MMGFPLDYLLQVLQTITYRFLPIDGMGGKCTFPVALFQVCHYQSPSSPKSIDNNNTPTTKPMESPLTLDNLSLEGHLSQKARPGAMLPPSTPRSVLALPAIVYETRNSPAVMKHPIDQTDDAVEDDVQRSMARRKKNEPPMDINKKCDFCGKIFKRPCDFTKHEKTHSRPWKCNVPDCKYYKQGWPTEKERDRHMNDRHSANPPEYRCKFSPCTYTSKRESNCKQHMEKAHGWHYVRSKNNGKRGKTPSPAGSVASPNPNQMIPPTPPTPAMSTPISSLSTELPSPANSHMASPYITDMSTTMSSMSTMSTMSHEPSIYDPSTYYEGFVDPQAGQHFNFNDPPMMPTCDFQLFPDTDLSTIGLEPFQNAEDFGNFNQALESSDPSGLITAPPSADMTLDQLGQDQLNPYCFDSEFYSYQAHNGMPEY